MQVDGLLIMITFTPSEHEKNNVNSLDYHRNHSNVSHSLIYPVYLHFVYTFFSFPLPIVSMSLSIPSSANNDKIHLETRVKLS